MQSNKTIAELDYSEDESDKEIALAFAKGLIKPGLNREINVSTTRISEVNNKKKLFEKLENLQLNLSWDETFDLTCIPAEIAPELALQLENHKSNQSKDANNSKEEDAIYNDFATEMRLYRLAQSAVLEGIPKLKKLGIPTRRPEDYFAEMAKSDEHMHKVRKKLKAKENRIIFSEKARKLRELKKFGKKVQIQRQLEKQAEKRKILEQLKKYKKGKLDSLDFLENTPDKADSNGIVKSKSQLKKELSKINNSRKHRDRKFGINGKQRGWKRNTAKDLDGPLDSVGKKIQRGKPNNKRAKVGKRPGKNVREEHRNKANSKRQKKGK